MYLNKNLHQPEGNYEPTVQEKEMAWKVICVLRSRFLTIMLPDIKLHIQPPEAAIINTANSLWTFINEHIPESNYALVVHVLLRKFIEKLYAIYNDQTGLEKAQKSDLKLLGDTELTKRDFRKEYIVEAGKFMETMFNIRSNEKFTLKEYFGDLEIVDDDYM